jgi:FixJ family two-component response regulator
VDDDISVCRAIKRLVRSLDMNAETFNSGAEFTKFIKTVPSFHADCAILDVQMPGMTGLEVQAWLAQAGNALPIIFITAHDEVGVRERALALGAVAFLHKPFDDELFAKTLRAALNTGSEET